MTLPEDPRAVIMCSTHALKPTHGCPVCGEISRFCEGAPEEDIRQAGPGTAVVHAARHEDYEEVKA